MHSDFSEGDFSPTCRKLINELYSDNARPIGVLVPEIVRALFALTDPRKAETFLLLLIESPAVSHQSVELLEPCYGIRSAINDQNRFLDAGNVPAGERNRWRPALSLILELHGEAGGRGFAELMTQKLKPLDDAQGKKAQRARAALGINKPPGAPRKTGQR
jgi:hypothetical protein